MSRVLLDDDNKIEFSISEVSRRSNPYPNITATLLGRKITFMTIASILDEIKTTCQEDRKLLIASCNIHSFNLSLHLPWFYDYMSSADIVRCDGVGILKTIQRLGLELPLQYQASGTRLVPELIAISELNHLSFFLLGSKPKNLECALNRLRLIYPGIEVDGHHGYFDKDDPAECDDIVSKINKAAPNILIVGMGMPIQEDWVYRHRERLNVNVILPCGAVIDRLAGMVNDCPEFISALGLEWLYRLIKEPKRLAGRYLLGNPAFAFQLALANTYSSPLKIEQSLQSSNGNQQRPYQVAQDMKNSIS